MEKEKENTKIKMTRIFSKHVIVKILRYTFLKFAQIPWDLTKILCRYLEENGVKI